MVERIKAVGQSIKKRRLTFVILLGILTVGVIGGLYAIQTGANFSGQTQAGDHNWYQDVKTQGFCENCHTAIGTDIATGMHKSATESTCSNCHSRGGNDHAAAAAACTDCHTNQATALESTTEAHNGIMASLGESPADASQTCQSCHTHAEVSMAINPDPPIPLKMGTPTTP